MSNLPYIIAVDFDGTLVSDQFPEIGRANLWLVDKCILWRKQGAKLILWTCRDGQRLWDAVNFCKRHGLFFDAINQNIPEVQIKYGCDTRKVFADVYIDDKANKWDGRPTEKTERLVEEIAFRNYNNEQDSKLD